MVNTIYIYFTKDERNWELSERAYRFVRDKAFSYFGKEPVLSYAEQGKPYFENIPLHFNISHCEKAVAIALGDCPVGVDIENIRPVNFKVAERFFTEDEQNTLKDDKEFFRIWTRKEAFAKKDGRGLSMGFHNIDTLRENIKTEEFKGCILSYCSDKEFKLEFLGE